jgi:hypothetical protein
MNGGCLRNVLVPVEILRKESLRTICIVCLSLKYITFVSFEISIYFFNKLQNAIKCSSYIYEILSFLASRQSHELVIDSWSLP